MLGAQEPVLVRSANAKRHLAGDFSEWGGAKPVLSGLCMSSNPISYAVDRRVTRVRVPSVLRLLRARRTVKWSVTTVGGRLRMSRSVRTEGGLHRAVDVEDASRAGATGVEPACDILILSPGADPPCSTTRTPDNPPASFASAPGKWSDDAADNVVQ